MKDFIIKTICCIGAGHVGGPTCAVIADQCPHIKVMVVDKSTSMIEAWQSEYLPIYEPGLDEIVQRRLNKNLFFSTDIENGIIDADLIFICVNTPTKLFGIGAGKAVDLTNLEKAADMILRYSNNPKIVVEKSTVPVKAAENIKKILSQRNKEGQMYHHIVISNPEFLSESNAIQDLMFPDRLLIGINEDCSAGKRALEALSEIYGCWVPKDKFLVTNTWSSELSKLVANAFLAQRVSSINSISAICEVTGADIRQVSHAVGMDHRVGSSFLNASIGFGGSCFKKDLLSLVYMCECLQLNEVKEYWQSVLDMNEYQKKRTAKRVFAGLMNNMKDKVVAIWGFAFKKNTRDTRDSAAIEVSKSLLEEGAIINIFDPQVPKKRIIEDLEITDGQRNVQICASELEACKGASAIVVCTEWEQFQSINFQEIYEIMNQPAYIFDGRLILDYDELRRIGFTVDAVGLFSNRNCPDPSNHSCLKEKWVTNGDPDKICDCQN